MAPEPAGGSQELAVDTDALRAFSHALEHQARTVGAIDSAATITAATDSLTGTAVAGALAEAATVLRDAHRRFADELASMARTAGDNAADYARTESAIAGELAGADGGPR